MSTDDDVRRAKEKLDRRTDDLVRSLTLEMLSRMVERTPIDTGRAAGNWNVSQDAPDDSVREVAGPKPSVTMRDVESAGVKSGGETYIVNNVPYIERLEDGYSGQAPQGMVKVTVAEVQPMTDVLVRELSRGL